MVNVKIINSKIVLTMRKLIAKKVNGAIFEKMFQKPILSLSKLVISGKKRSCFAST
jgi:hypothetical protein